MLRKHTILMSQKDLEYDAPFYSWNCLTISLRNRNDIYLIIKNEKVLKDFLKLLIYKTETLDGTRGTAIKFKQV